MIDLAFLLLLAIATQRLVFLWLTQDIFRGARTGLSYLGAYMSYLVNCPVCMTVWSAAILFAFWHLSWLGQWIVWTLAISGTVLAVDSTLVLLDKRRMA